jgi:hypothetical protein
VKGFEYNKKELVMRVNVPIVFLTIVTISIITGCGQQQVSFSKDVQPVLNASCLDCHDGKGEGSEKTDFLITSYEEVMKGTQFGPVVVAGDSLSSTLYRTISHQTDPKIQMPPHHNVSLAEGRSEPLKHDEIEMVKNWIDQGAKNN